MIFYKRLFLVNISPADVAMGEMMNSLLTMKYC